MQTPRGNGDTWSIVLAAGDGTRLLSVTERLYGETRPKQFAALRGRHSMLQQTVGRLRRLVRPERSVVVVAERWRSLAEQQMRICGDVDLVAQPRNLGTGPGVLLPLARVMARAPQATVIVTPSDHDFRRPDLFVAALPAAMRVAEQSAAGVCLVAVEAESAATDLGWIVPGRPIGDRGAGAEIAAFVEKPPASEATALRARGGVWNTFVLVGHADRLWALATAALPAQARLFSTYLAAVDTARDQETLAAIYPELTCADFSRDVLAKATGLGVLPVRGCGWSDMGTPARVFESLDGTPELAALKRRLAAGGPWHDSWGRGPSRATA